MSSAAAAASSHDVRVSVQKELVTTFGSSHAETVVLGYDVGCSCGWQAYYPTLAEANEACGRHSNGLDPTPTSHEDTMRDLERRKEEAREEFERVRERMLATGDPFCE